jgi:L-aminopeptidase/D-esterase-like protein
VERARDLGVPFDGIPGPLNAITDIPGVLVGHTTLIDGEGAHAIRTGVTAIFPRAELGYYPAASFILNGDAELSGAIFAEEYGMLRSPIMLTGTASNGTVYTSVIKWSARKFPDLPVHMPVVADTWDADLSNYLAFPLREEHVFAALDVAKTGPVAEGNVGGGTGMICHGFKCGIGTASRVIPEKYGGYTVGVLVQANYGEREDLRVAGVPVGREIKGLLPVLLPASTEPPASATPKEDGSILIIVGTDAPVSALTLKAMARRAVLGLARNGSTANPFSGDVVLAFSTTPIVWPEKPPYLVQKQELFQYAAEHLHTATVQATEEAIINALVAGKTMTGLNGSRVYALPHDALRDALRRYNRLKE